MRPSAELALLGLVLAAFPLSAAAAAGDRCAEARAKLSAADRARLDSGAARFDEATCRLVEAGAPGGGARASGAAGLEASGLDAAGRTTAAAGKAKSLGGGKLFDGGGASGTPGSAQASAGGPSGGAAGAGLAPALNAELEERFGSTGVGRELLADFREPSGAVTLPPIVLTDLGGGAIVGEYDHNTNSVWLDQANAARDAGLKSAKGLTAYLAAHPEARKAVLDLDDTTVFHELTHARQHKRDGALPSIDDHDPAEIEVEAYREELRYFHERLLADPALAAKSSDLRLYRMLLADYDAFRAYASQLSLGGSTMPTLEQALARRKDPAAARELDKLKTVDAAYRKREADFAAKVLPKMREEGYPVLIAQARASGDATLALGLVAEAPAEIRAKLGPAALEDALAFLRKDPPAPVEKRLDAWQAYLAYRGAADHSNEMPNDLFLLYKRDYRAAYDAKLAAAAGARGKARVDALEWAEAYASYLPDKTALLAKAKALRQAK